MGVLGDSRVAIKRIRPPHQFSLLLICMIQVALVDDFSITRRGIRSLVEISPDIRVTQEADNGSQLLELLKKQPAPDIAIIDINMPIMDGFATISALKEAFPDIRCIVLSQLQEDDAIINMISRGASGYLHKSTDPLLIIKAIKAVYQSGFYCSRSIRGKNLQNIEPTQKNDGFNGREVLTRNEVDLIRLSASNLTFNQIAELMNLSPKTVQNYRDNLFNKLQIHTRSALTLYGVKNGIILT